MELALLAGLVIGVVAGIKLIDHVLLVIFHASFLSADTYINLYDRLDIKANFEMMQSQKNPPKTYAEFLSLHEKHRSHAVSDFKHLIKGATKYILAGYFIILIPALLFAGSWHWYVVGIVVAQLLHAIYRIIVREHGQGFYVTLMLLTILSKKAR